MSAPTTVTPPASAGEQSAAVAAWDEYKRAVLDADGAAAADVLSKGTLGYFGDLVDATLHADQARLDELSVADIMTVLLARYEFRYKTLSALDGRSFVALAIDNGLISEATVARQAFTRAELSGEAGRLLAPDPEQLPPTLDLRKEAGRWKVHLVPLIASVSRMLDREASKTGASRSAYALSIVQRGRPQADDSLFRPMR